MLAEPITYFCNWRFLASLVFGYLWLSVTVNAQQINVNSVTVCAGGVASLTVSGCNGTIQWSGNGVNGTNSVLDIQTTDAVLTPQILYYTATCTVAGNSTAIVSTVTLLPLPSVNVIATSKNVTSGQSVTLTAVGCLSGTVNWSNGSLGSTLIVNPTTTIIYSATCTTGPRCQALGYALINVSGGQRNPALTLSKKTNKTVAQVGEIVSYTLTLVNTSTSAVSNIFVRDSVNGGVASAPGSITPSIGSITPQLPVNLWYIATLPANATATVSFSYSILSPGIIYSIATLPGDTNRVCTTVPVKFCTNEPIEVEMNAPAGYINYQWYRNGLAIALATSRSYTATEIGEYTVLVNQGVCPNGSCCPVVIQRDSVPQFAILPKTPTCLGGQPLNNGTLTVNGLGVNPSQYQFAISEGSSFTLTTPVVASVPANGVLASNLTGDRDYTVRIYNSNGCYRDVSTRITTNCQCPPQICVPAMIKKTKSRLAIR